MYIYIQYIKYLLLENTVFHHKASCICVCVCVCVCGVCVVSDYAKKCSNSQIANHLGVLARHKLPLGSTQPPATQVTHARRDSAQF